MFDVPFISCPIISLLVSVLKGWVQVSDRADFVILI